MNVIQNKRILIVDDDEQVLQLVSTLLESEGAHVHTAPDGESALRLFFTERPDLVVLDVNMPKQSGIQLCATMRQLSDTPIIFLSGMDEDETIVQGLDCGAVDYVIKPFRNKVFRARVNAALRQSALLEKQEKPVTYSDGYLTVDLPARRVVTQDTAVRLTTTEFNMLAYLLQNANRVCTFEQILENVWGWEYRDSTEYVYTYVRRLRRKLEQGPDAPRYILAEHGTGYIFETH